MTRKKHNAGCPGCGQCISCSGSAPATYDAVIRGVTLFPGSACDDDSAVFIGQHSLSLSPTASNVCTWKKPLDPDQPDFQAWFRPPVFGLSSCFASGQNLSRQDGLELYVGASAHPQGLGPISGVHCPGGLSDPEILPSAGPNTISLVVYYSGLTGAGGGGFGPGETVERMIIYRTDLVPAPVNVPCDLAPFLPLTLNREYDRQGLLYAGQLGSGGCAFADPIDYIWPATVTIQ